MTCMPLLRAANSFWAACRYLMTEDYWGIAMPMCSFTPCAMPSKAANMRDIGYHFPDTSDETKDMDSKIILRRTVELIGQKGYKVGNIDATVCAQHPKLNPFIPEMCKCMAEVIGCDPDCVSVKATTTEHLGFTGREEGISAYAVCLITK